MSCLQPPSRRWGRHLPQPSRRRAIPHKVSGATRRSLYGYFPTLGGTSSVPVDTNGTPIEISAEKILDSLKFTLMGTFVAHNGRWGIFTDLLYLNLGGSEQNS